MQNDASGLIFFVLVIIAVLLAGQENIIAEKTFYFSYCGDKKHSVHDCPDKIYTTSSTYKVLIEQQKVIAKSVWGVEEDGDKCKVFDEENWYCVDGQGNSVSSRGGAFYESTRPCVKQGEYSKVSCFPLYLQTEYLSFKYRNITNFFQ